MRGLILFSAVLLAGCAALSAGDKQRRVEYLASAPHTKDEFRAAIHGGRIMRGMSKEEVLASWGSPCSYCTGTRSASWGDAWEYNPFGSAAGRKSSSTYVYFDGAGQVSGWSGP